MAKNNGMAPAAQAHLAVPRLDIKETIKRCSWSSSNRRRLCCRLLESYIEKKMSQQYFLLGLIAE